jgi:NAD+ kinase
MKQFAIVKKNNEKSNVLAEVVRAKLFERGYVENPENPELIFVVGGDGSVLFAIQEYIDKIDNLEIVGVHSGNLGFLMDYREEDLNDLINDLENGNIKREEYPLLEIKTDDETYYALNEARFENLRKTQEVEVYINDEKFEDFSGSGLLVTTQLGTTAYNRSLGGAIIEKGLDLFELTEIAATSRNNLHSIGVSLVVNDNTKFGFFARDFEDTYLGFDSRLVPMQGKTKIEIRKSERTVKILRRIGNNYYDTLKKLF